KTNYAEAVEMGDGIGYMRTFCKRSFGTEDVMERTKILVVDDESRMRKLVKDFLQKNNYEVLEAGDGSEALDIFFAQNDIALVILDVMMPKMDGWQVCREIRNYS